MSKVKVHLRIAKNDGGRTRYKVDASPAPNYKPLTKGSGYSETILPTLAFAVVLEIPDEAFRQAEQVVAEIQVPADLPAIAAEVVPSA